MKLTENMAIPGTLKFRQGGSVAYLGIVINLEAAKWQDLLMEQVLL